MKIKTGHEIWLALEQADARDDERFLNELGNLKFVVVEGLVAEIQKFLDDSMAFATNLDNKRVDRVRAMGMAVAYEKILKVLGAKKDE